MNLVGNVHLEARVGLGEIGIAPEAEPARREHLPAIGSSVSFRAPKTSPSYF